MSTLLCWSQGVPQTCFQADTTPPARIPSTWTHEVFRKQDRTWGRTRGRWAHGSALWLTVQGSNFRTTPWWCRRGYVAQLSLQWPGMVQPVSKSLLSDHCVQGGPRGSFSDGRGRSVNYTIVVMDTFRALEWTLLLAWCMRVTLDDRQVGGRAGTLPPCILCSGHTRAPSLAGGSRPAQSTWQPLAPVVTEHWNHGPCGRGAATKQIH